MKTLRLTCLIIVLFVSTGKAQVITNYSFTASSGTFTALSGPNTATLTGTADEGYWNAFPIGFDFWYVGSRYTTVSASTNGWLTLGANITNATNANSLTTGGAPRPVIAPLWDDLNVQANANFSYLTTGSAGNRILTIQYLNCKWNSSATGNTISFQVRLYETTGKIDFVYRSETGTVNAGSASIGISATSTGSGNFLSLNGTGFSPTASSTAETATLSSKPATGRTYSFTPAVPATPINLTFTSILYNSLTLNWLDNSSNETRFVIYRSTDGINYSFVSQTTANATSSVQSGLSASTTYYWKVYAVSEGGLSTALSGSQLTACASVPAAPTVTTPVTYCQNATAIQLTATGTNLIWGGGSGTAGGTASLATTTYIDGSFNNKKVNFTTTAPNVTINTVDYYIPAYQTVSGLVLSVYNSVGTVIATSSTSTSLSAGASAVKITNTFNYTIVTAGNYSIGVSAGTGNIGSDNPTLPITESTGTINITGVSVAGYRCFNNIQFTVGSGSTAPTPGSANVGTTAYYVTQTVGGCTSTAATINVVVTAGPSISQVPSNNIIGYYKFSGNANDFTANNNGTLQNAPASIADRFGNAARAYSFDGSTQYISTSRQYTNPNTFTISVWFKTATTTGGKLIGFGTSQTGLSGQYDRHIYMNNAGQLYFGVYPGTVKTINSTLSYNDNNWHLATATLSSLNGMVLYVDGLPIASDAATTTAENYTGYWRIGYDNNNGWTSQPSGFYFSGTLDDALVFSNALTATEVQTLYTSPDGAGNNGPVCSGSAFSLNATTVSGATYAWTGPNSFTSASQNPTLIYTAATAGTYTLQVTASGCTSTAYTNVVASTNAGQWTGNLSTDWSVAGNWCSGSVPLATTNVTITAGATNMPSINSSVVCNNLTINAGASVTTTAAGTLNIAGILTNNGTMTNSGTTNFNGPSGQQTFSGVAAFNNLTVSNASGLLLPASITVNNNLLISAGSLSAGSFAISVKGNWTNNASASGFTAATSAVSFNGSAAQLIGGTFATTFNNLTIANTGSTVTLGSNAPVAGNLTVSSGTFDLLGYTINRTTTGGILTVSNNATLKIGGTNSFPTQYATNTLVVASSVEYSGTNQTIANQVYGNLLLSSSTGVATKTFPATALIIIGNLTSTVGAGTSVSFTAASDITISGNVNIGASTTFNGGSYLHGVAGNWTNSGTFNGNTGTVRFSGPGSIIGGSGAQNFNNLTVAVSLINFANNAISLSGNLATTGSGSFSQASGGTLTMTGSGKTISGSGISLDNLTVTGTVTTAVSLNLTGNLSVSGSLTASAGTITMTGISKTIAGAGTKRFSTLAVSGTITTAVDFSIASGMNVAGSLTASAGTATFTGTSTLSGTANLFNTIINGISLQLSASSVLGVAGTLTITAGTLNTSSSTPNTVNFNGTGAQNINAIPYNNLSLFNGSNKTAVAGITVNNSITIGSGTTFIPGNFTHSIYRDWNNYGSFTAGTSTIQFLGNQNNNINGATTFNILTVNNSSAATGMILQSNVSAATVNMTMGTILTGANTLTITSTRTGNGIILGNIKRTHAFTTGVAYAFEGPDNTIIFSTVSSVNSVTVSVAKGSVTDFPYASAISRVYNIVVPAGTYTATLRLHYQDDELNGNQESNMGIWSNDGTVTGWIPVGKTGNSTVSNYVEQSGITNLSNRWTCSINPSVVLWNGSLSTDWNNPSNWTVYVGGASTPPAANDVVVLGGIPFTYQPSISTAVNVKNVVFSVTQPVNLSMTGAGSLTSGDILGVWSSNVTHTINTNNQSITVNGNLSLSDGVNGHAINLTIGTGTLNVIGSLYQAGGANIVFSGAGNLNIANDFNYVNGTFTPSTGTVTYNGTVNQVIGTVNYNNLTINNSAATPAIANITNITGNLTITAGELDNNSTTTIGGNVSIAPAATLDNRGILHVGGNWVNNGSFSSNGTNVIFDGSGTQTISATTFNNLEFNKPGGSLAILTGDVILKGNLLGTSGTLDIGTYFFNRDIPGGTATMSDAATLIIGADNAPNKFSNYYMAPASTVIFNGTGTQHLLLPGMQYGNLIFRNTGNKVLYTPTTVKGDLTIENGASFDGGANTITLDGNWTNNGTFIPSASVIVCTGTAKNFSGNTTFYRLSVYGTYTFLNDNTIDNLLIINPTGSLSGGSTITTTMNGDLINKGILYTLGTSTFTGNVLQTLSLINAVQTVAITVNFNGSVSPVLNSTSAPQFGYLNINNTGGVNPSVGWTIAYGLTVGAGASFNGGSSSHTVLGYVTNNGTISSSGTFSFIPTSAVTVNLGTDFSSTGRVYFGGVGAMTLTGTPVSFNNVNINSTNVAGITPSSDWNLSGDLRIVEGSVFNAVNHNYMIAGNISNSGTINSGTSTFVLNGTDMQDINSASAFNNLTINKASGIATLSSNITINAVLDFISGKIQTGTNTLVQPFTGTCTGAAQNTGWVNGNLQKAIATGVTAKAFEVGDNNIYSPATVSFNNVTNAGNLKLAVFLDDHPALSSSSINTEKNVDRYWVFSNNGIVFTNYDATFKYAVSDIDSGSTSAVFGAGLYTGSNWLYPVTGTVTDTSAVITGVTSFGEIAIGEICNKGTAISYTGSPYCAGAGTAAVTLTGNSGGSYSSTTGLSIDASTGLVTLGTSIPGTYEVTYTIASTGECPSYITSANIVINPEPYATGSYQGSPFCSGAGTVYPSGSSNGAGIFSSTTGLVIDPVTGGVDLAASALGTYTITYTIPAAGGCGQFQASSSITITAPGTWTGTVNTDWNNSGNWICGEVPVSTTNVTIQSGSANMPHIMTVQALNDLTIQAGASVTVTAGIIQIEGTISNAGIFNVSAGTVQMNGSSAQTIPAAAFTGDIIKNLIISNNVSLAGTDTLTGTLTIADGKTFTTNDNLNLRSDSYGTARIATLPVDGAGNATAFITGNVSIERYIPLRKAWRLLSAPVKAAGSPNINAAWQEGLTTASANPNLHPGYGMMIQGGTVANGFDQGPTVFPFVKVYNNAANTFTALPAIPGTMASITNYPGYFIYIRGDRSVNLMQGTSAAVTATTLRIKGQVNTGSQTTGVNATNYTVLGNPFPSAINFETLTRNNVKNAFYVWDPKLAGNYGLGAYVTFSWNNGTGMYDMTTAASPLSKYIPSGEAILIESLDAVNPGTITIKESDKIAAGSDAVFGRPVGVNGQVRVDLYAINADATTSLLDGVLTTYADDNGNEVNNEDARKLSGGSENIGIKRDGKMLAIERRKTISANDTSYLNIYQMKIQSYQFAISMSDMAQPGTIALLKDSYSNALNNMPLDMQGTTSVTFSINSDPASYATNRFSIVFAAQAPLPVKFISVKAKRDQMNISVSWKTAEEQHVKNYEVERSSDGRNFTKLSTTAATAINGGGASYSYLDTDPIKGTNYYRIRSVDQDGAAGYSVIVKVVMEAAQDIPSFAVYPNPVTGNTISMQFNNIEKGNYTLKLFNATGQLVAVKDIKYTGTGTPNFEVSDGFTAGKYELQLTGNNTRLNIPLIKR